MLTAADLIAALRLQPLPQEGGYYRETYRSADRLHPGSLPPHYRSSKSASTAIYYLLTPETISALHRLPTDELFHFYVGDPVQMLQLSPDGRGHLAVLGTDVLAGQVPQLVVPRWTWQGSFLMPGSKLALLGTTMAPGFDFADYEAADGEDLVRQYPEFAEMIRRLAPPREKK